MSRLPRSFAEALEGISSPDGGAAAVARGISALLDAERRCGDLARAVESFREAARTVGILEEARSGLRIYDAWCKLSRFFLEPLDALKHEVVGDPADVAPAPVGFETVASLWEKTGPEIAALLEEHRALDRTLQESPTTAHVGYRVRSKLLLLDRRAERVKVALDLFRADLARAARSGAVRIEGMLGGEAAGGRRIVSWLAEALDVVYPEGGKPRAKGVTDLKKRLEQGLSRAGSIDETREILGAASVLLRATALQGQPVLLDFSGALRAMEELRVPGSSTIVVGLGDAGYALLGLLGSGFRRYFLDLETTRIRVLDPEVTQIVLEGSPEGTRYSEILRSAYRSVAGPTGLPQQLAEVLTDARAVVHVVVGMEDPWVTLAPELLFDLRSFLDWGNRGRSLVHSITRPLPRNRGTFREAVQEIERARTFDDAFIVCASEQQIAGKVASFLQLTLEVPELLVRPQDVRMRGCFSSYGTAPVSLAGAQGAEETLSRLDAAFRIASPNWFPANPVLSEIAPEQVSYVHPPEAPLPEVAWKLCPELVPIPVPGTEPTLCRIQRGLRLEDLRLV